LNYLLNGAGFFHQAHRATDDCHALLEILALELPTTGTPALAVLLEQARKKTMRVWAEQSPFDLKNAEAMDAMAGRGHGTSMSTKASWATKSRFLRPRSISGTWSRACRP
jgi:hypothetical protein